MSDNSGFKRATGLALAAAFAFAPRSAGAQSEQLAQLQGPIDEIIVTATKRETSLLFTPLSITALSGETLETLGALNFEDYFSKVPGLNAVDEGPGRKTYVVRGVNNRESAFAQATVAQYLDEVPITNNQGRQPDPLLVDIERVEVLRGPQGTLFGARSLSGAVRTITRKPVMNDVEARGRASLSFTKFGGANINLDSAINIPIIDDELAMRVVGYYSARDGYIDNDFPGGVFTPTFLPPGVPPPPPVALAPIQEENINDYLAYGGRALMRWQPNERLTLDLMAMAQIGRNEGSPTYFRDATGDESEGLITTIVNTNGNDDDSWTYNATLAYEMDWAEWTTVASYFTRDTTTENFDSTAGIATMGGPGSSRTFGEDTNIYALETRMATTLDGPLQVLAGLYYFDEQRLGEQVRFEAFRQATVAQSTFDARQDEFAVFGELNFDVTDRLTLTAGGRYSEFDSTVFRVFFISPPMSNIPLGPELNPPRYSESATSLKFLAGYDVSDKTYVFVQAAQGLRPGGFNPNFVPGLTTFPETFESDSLWNYEIGGRTELWDDRLFLDGAIYYIDWSNIIVESFGAPPGGGPQVINFPINAGSAEISAIELAANMRLARGFNVDIAFNHFFSAELTEDFPPANGNFIARAGDDLPYNAKTSLNVGMQYRQPIGGGWDGSLRLDWRYVGKRTSGFRPLNADNTINNAYNEYDDYSLFNLRAGVEREQWRLSVFANNLFDARPVVNQRNFFPFDIQTRVSPTPRTVGISIETSI